MWQSIKATYEERVGENHQEHVAVIQQSVDYCGNVHWELIKVEYYTSAGSLFIDGTGCTRIYNNRHRGCQSAAVAYSTVTKKPLALVVSQMTSSMLVIQHLIGRL